MTLTEARRIADSTTIGSRLELVHCANIIRNDGKPGKDDQRFRQVRAKIAFIDARNGVSEAEIQKGFAKTLRENSFAEVCEKHPGMSYVEYLGLFEPNEMPAA
jgi:hypothetical protein